MQEDGLTIGAEVGGQVSYKDCSEWTDVPGGYNVYLSVFDQTDPNFDMAYGLVPEFEPKLANANGVSSYADHPASARVVCINRITTMGLDFAEAGW